MADTLDQWLDAELARCSSPDDWWWPELHDHRRALTLLKEARAALRFYADPMTYFAIGFFPDPPCGEFWDDFEDIVREEDGAERRVPGKLARATLAGKPTNGL
jgi:hypothetical protein